MVLDGDGIEPGFRVITFHTMTGKIWADIPVTEDTSWSLGINDTGGLGCSIPVNADEVKDLDLRTGTLENRMSLAVAYGDFILEAGPIVERSYTIEDDLLNLTAEGVWSIFFGRKVLPAWALLPGAQKVTSAKISISGVNYTGLVRELVRYGIESPPWGSGKLPIVLPPLETGTERRVYNGFDLRWVGNVLQELTEEENGPDIRFRPRFNEKDATYIEWALEVGKPLLKQTGPNHVWDGTVEGTGVVGFGATSNGRKMAAKAWRPGSGQEADMPLAEHTDRTMLDQGYPWLELDTASKQEADEGVLKRLARQDIQAAAGPELSFTINVDALTTPVLGEYLPGDWADVVVPDGHPLIPAGQVTVRIMGVDGDDTNTVKLTVAPVIGDLTGSPNPDGPGTIGTDPEPLPPFPAPQQFPGYNLYPGEIPEGYGD